jgi:hypothetical protein
MTRLAALVERAFDNQQTLNERLSPDWTEQGWPYYRAVWTELAEAIGHTNWYWWKQGTYKTAMSKEQLGDLHIELCDILHFGLSLDIVSSVHGGPTKAAMALRYVLDFQDVQHSAQPLDEALEGCVVDAILQRRFNTFRFARACHASGLDLPQLLTYYFGKSALNEFRWNNGYNLTKDDPKVYVKMWKLPGMETAKEDNWHLNNILKTFVANNTAEDLTAGLEDGTIQTSLHVRFSDMYSRIER